MTQHSELAGRLIGNRQRLAIERLTRLAQSLLPPTVGVVDAVQSAELARELQLQFKSRRPREAGNLLVTESKGTFAAMVKQYFSERADVTFHAFLAHWEDAGGLILSGADLAEHAVQLLSFDGDGLYGCISDKAEMFSLDFTLSEGTEIYELFFFATAARRNANGVPRRT
jgi:hypothetical protein